VLKSILAQSSLRRASPRPDTHQWRPALERLENRTVPDASFQVLGTVFAPGETRGEVTTITGISNDGSVLSGGVNFVNEYGHNKSEAIAWQSGAFRPLGRLNEPINGESWATAVSANGEVVVGFSRTWNYQSLLDPPQAFRYVHGAMQPLGFLYSPAPEEWWLEAFSAALDVSADGSIIVGRSRGEDQRMLAFRWAETQGMVALPTPAGYGSSAESVSEDGTTITGWIKKTEAGGQIVDFRAVIWSANGTLVDLSVPYPVAMDNQYWPQGEVHIAGNGAAVAGVIDGLGSGAPMEAFRWTATTGAVRLGVLPGEQFSYVTGLNFDGSVAVGLSGSAESYADGFIWDTDHGLHDLKSYLSDEYGLSDSIQAWSHLWPYAVNSTDLWITIAGLGIDPLGDARSWVARSPFASDIKITRFAWDYYGSVLLDTVTYGKDLTADTTVELYWANGTGYANRIGPAVWSGNLDRDAGTFEIGHYHDFEIPALQFEKPPPGATHIIAVADPKHLINDVRRDNNVRAIPLMPNLAPVSWNRAGAGINLTFKLTGKPLTSQQEYDVVYAGAVYWANGETENDLIGDPINGRFLKVGTKPNTFSLHVADAWLKNRPEGADRLAFVVDPWNWVEETDEGDNIKTLFPDVRLFDATTTDFKSVRLHYSISGGATLDPFVVRAYRSTDETFDETDEPIGETTITNPVYRQAGPGGSEKVHTKAFIKMPAGYAPSRAAPFLIVVVDPDGKVVERDEDNNTLFVIPLFGPGRKGGFNAATGAFQFAGGALTRESHFAGPIMKRLSRGSPDVDLVGLNAAWGGTFKDEESGRLPGYPVTAYAGDDLLVDPALVPLVQRYQQLIELARRQQRLKTQRVEITEAFDQQGEHTEDSLHYEGRAIDVVGDYGNNKVIERLTGLAMLAGFDWVNNELAIVEGRVIDHAHMSARGAALIAPISVLDLIGAVDFGFTSTPKLIRDETLHAELRGLLVRVDDLLSQPLTTQSRAEAIGILKQFKTKVAYAPETKLSRIGLAQGMKSKTKGLLIANADLLILWIPSLN